MAIPRLLAAASLAALLCSALPAAAQDQLDPTTQIDVTFGTPPSEVAAGGMATFPLTISFGAGNMVCTQDTTVPIEVSVSEVPGPVTGLTVALDRSTVDIELSMGQYLLATTDGQGSATINVTAAASAPAPHNHTLNVTASFPGGTIAGCSATGPFPEATANAETTFEVTGGAPTGTGTGTGTNTGTGTETGGGGKKKDSPAPVIPGVMLALLALAAVVRRRL